MAADFMVSAGIAVCIFAIAGLIVALITFRAYKKRLEKQLDISYGKKR